MKLKFIKSLYLVWILLFVVVPIVLVIFQSFIDIDGNISLINYQTFFSTTYLRMTLNSFVYATIITAVTLLLGYPTAYIISTLKHRNLVLMLVVLPSWINLLLKTYAFMSILGTNGPLNKIFEFLSLPPAELLFSLPGFIIVATYIYLPFMVLPIYNSIIKIPASNTEAAADLGATKFQIIQKVIVPLSMKGVYSGIQVVFIPTLSIFMITRLIAGNRIITLGTAVEQHFLVTGNWGMGSAIGVILIIILVLSIILSKKISSKRGTSE